MFTLQNLLDSHEEATPRRAEAREIVFSDVQIDSRRCASGSLFVALPGEQQDGHDFIEDALERGCLGVLASSRQVVPSRREQLGVQVYLWQGQRWSRRGATTGPILVLVPDPLKALQQLAAFWRARFSPVVIGITGSVGKSTTKELIATVLAQRFATLKNPKSYNNEIGLPLTLLRLRAQHQVAVLEMGTYGPGEITELTEIARPQIGVVTNVSHSHLERMGTLAMIQQAKAELPAALPADGLAVLNGDELLIRQMADLTSAPVLYYGRSESCHLRATEVRSKGLDGVSFEVEFQGERQSLHCPLPGQHIVHNALAAIAVGRHLGLSWEAIERGLQNPAAHLRLLPVPALQGATLLDDSYNASPVSCRAALNLLAEMPGRKIAVLGDMLELGSFEEEGHRQVGRWAAEVVELLIVLGSRATWIGQAALDPGGLSPQQVHFAADHDAVVKRLTAYLQPGDVVLIKGSRAMEMDQLVNALRQPPANQPPAESPFERRKE